MREIPSPLSGFASPFGRIARFSPLALFANAEPGQLMEVDPQYLFTDTAGTTPVTAPGQAVALHLDRSGRGNNDTQGTLASRPIYGRHPASGYRNLLAASEQFDNAAWVKNASNALANSTTDPNEEATADTLRLNAGTALATSALGLFANSVPYISQSSGSALVAGAHTYSLYVKGGAGLSHVQLRVGLAATLNPDRASTVVRLSDGVVVDGTGTVSNAGNGWWRVSLPFTATAAVHHCGIWFWNQTSIASAAGTEGVFVSGAQLEPGSTATAYQRTGTPSGLAFPAPVSYDITEAGQRDLHYLHFNGTSSSFVSPTITPGTDKVQVVAGVRTLSTALGTVIESSLAADGNAGAFYLRTNAGNLPQYQFLSRGSAANASAVFALTVQESSVVSGLSDVAGPITLGRKNGVQLAFSNVNPGAGNFLDYPIYKGRRGGTSLPFNGLYYGSVIRFGPNLTADQISAVERWMAQRTGVTI